jgi:secretion/DNA translocation related TadE-like protein
VTGLAHVRGEAYAEGRRGDRLGELRWRPPELRGTRLTHERCRCDGGSATVAVVGAIALLLVLTVAGLSLGSAVLASHRARSAVDLAALAGASALMSGDSLALACARASGVARRGDAAIVSCTAAGGDSLTVRGEVSASIPLLGRAVATARAGPAARGSG